MNKNIAKISYDKKSRVLSIEVKKGRSSDSDIHGNVVIDYDKKGAVIRVNFYDFNFESFHKSRKSLNDFIKEHRAAILSK